MENKEIENKLIVDVHNKFIYGQCKAKDFKAQIEALRESVGK